MSLQITEKHDAEQQLTWHWRTERNFIRSDSKTSAVYQSINFLTISIAPTRVRKIIFILDKQINCQENLTFEQKPECNKDLQEIST